MMAPAAALFLAEQVDLYALDERTFGEPDPDQPDPREWREDGGEE